MFPELLPVLACPWCRSGGLIPDRKLDETVRTINLVLTCPSCPKTSEVKKGIWHAMGPVHMQRSIAQFTNVWPNAIFYESLWRPGSLTRFTGRKFPLSEELGELVSALKPGPGDIMVDVAASEGLYARSLAANGATVMAIEHSVPFLKKVLKRSIREKVRVVPVRAIAQRLPVIDGSVEGVGIGGSMNEIGNRSEAISEMARVLKHGSSAFSMHLLTAATGPGRALQGSVGPTGINFATAEEWTRLFSEAGFNIQSSHIEKIVQRLHAVRA